jgi:large subunit ribosomal protein L3
VSEEELNPAAEENPEPTDDSEGTAPEYDASPEAAAKDSPATEQSVDADAAAGDSADRGSDAEATDDEGPQESEAEEEALATEAEADEIVADEEAVSGSDDDETVSEADLKRLLGRKVGMTQIFDDTGAAVPVTLIEAGPCYITQIRQHRTDGYTAVQLAFEEANPRRLTGGELGHLKRNDLPPLKHLREFRVRKLGDLKEGARLTVSVFEIGDRVDVVGTSKGRGFAGAIKRHGFHRGPKTHGQSDRERAPGSHGATSTPGRVFKGSRGPGHMGATRVSSQNLRVALVDAERNLLGVRGSVPGHKGGLVMVKERRKQ